MLVLTRKINQSVIIGNNIKITLLDIRKDGARIGISAPRNITVFRQEVFDEIQKENLASSKVDSFTVEHLSEILKKD